MKPYRGGACFQRVGKLGGGGGGGAGECLYTPCGHGPRRMRIVVPLIFISDNTPAVADKSKGVFNTLFYLNFNTRDWKKDCRWGDLESNPLIGIEICREGNYFVGKYGAI